MVSVVTDTVDIYCFCKNRYETAQEYLPFRLPTVSLKQIEKFLHFSFKTGRKYSLIQNLDPPGTRKPDPPGSENVRISGVAGGGGDGQDWH